MSMDLMDQTLLLRTVEICFEILKSLVSLRKLLETSFSKTIFSETILFSRILLEQISVLETVLDKVYPKVFSLKL